MGAAPSCTGGRRPLLDRPRFVGPRALLLAPEVLVGRAGSTEQATIADVLRDQLKAALSHEDIETIFGASVPGTSALRTALLDAWRTGRTQRLGRLKTGADLGLQDALGPAVAAGATTVVLPVLTRTGPVEGPDGYVPRPMDEILRRPGEQRPREIPQAGETAAKGGVDLDVVVVDAGSGRVVTHRRVSYPVSDPPDVANAVPVMVREAVRGLHSGQ